MKIYLLNFWKRYNFKKCWKKIHFEIKFEISDVIDIGIFIDFLDIRFFGFDFSSWTDSMSNKKHKLFMIQLLNFGIDINNMREDS